MKTQEKVRIILESLEGYSFPHVKPRTDQHPRERAPYGSVLNKSYTGSALTRACSDYDDLPILANDDP